MAGNYFAATKTEDWAMSSGRGPASPEFKRGHRCIEVKVRTEVACEVALSEIKTARGAAPGIIVICLVAVLLFVARLGFR